MKQKIEVKMIFSDLSQTLKIMNVYQKGNTLIAVSGTEDTGNYGEAMCMRKDSVSVEINGDKELPVKHYIVNKNGRRFELEKNYSEVTSVEKIREIIGIDPLPIDRSREKDIYPGSVLGQGLFSGSDSDEPEFDYQKNQVRPV